MKKKVVTVIQGSSAKRKKRQKCLHVLHCHTLTTAIFTTQVPPQPLSSTEAHWQRMREEGWGSVRVSIFPTEAWDHPRRRPRRWFTGGRTERNNPPWGTSDTVRVCDVHRIPGIILYQVYFFHVLDPSSTQPEISLLYLVFYQILNPGSLLDFPRMHFPLHKRTDTHLLLHCHSVHREPLWSGLKYLSSYRRI